MPTTRYNREIDGANEIRVRIVAEQRRVLDFTVQYEAQIGGQWYNIVRYDTAHGYPHRDLLDEDGHNLDKKFIGGTTKEVLQYALNDIVENWQQYRQAFIERMRP